MHGEAAQGGLAHEGESRGAAEGSGRSARWPVCEVAREGKTQRLDALSKKGGRLPDFVQASLSALLV
jgi:hypothetical protein